MQREDTRRAVTAHNPIIKCKIFLHINTKQPKTSQLFSYSDAYSKSVKFLYTFRQNGQQQKQQPEFA